MSKKLPRTAWKEGKSGNPNGRPPKGYSITETVKAMLNEKPEIKKALATKVMEMSMKGDVTAMKMLWNYMDGMPLQQVDQKTDGKLEITITEEKERPKNND